MILSPFLAELKKGWLTLSFSTSVTVATVGVSFSGRIIIFPISTRTSLVILGSDFNLFNSDCVDWYFRKRRITMIKKTDEKAIKMFWGVRYFFSISGILAQVVKWGNGKGFGLD